MELINKKDLYDKVVKLERKALEQMKTFAKLGDTEEYNKMNAVLMERTAFKHDVMDAPVVLNMPDSGIGDLSDGYHTFNGLYEQRAILFATIVNAYKDKSWKSHRHEDGELCFGGGWFIVGIDTPKGSYTYHYEDKYWDMFNCVELENGKHWDGHTEADAETRLMSLQPEPHWIPVTERLPNDSNRVLITHKGGVSDGWYNGRYWERGANTNHREIKTVTAWMPFPKKYKEH